MSFFGWGVLTSPLKNWLEIEMMVMMMMMMMMVMVMVMVMVMDDYYDV